MSSEYEHKNYQRNNKGESQGRKEPSPQMIRELIKSGDNDLSIISKIRSKYNDQEMVDAIFDGYKDRLEYITKKARKFKQLIYDKYSKYNLPYPKLLKKAQKYAKRYELADDEFQLFLNYSFNDGKYSSNVVNLPNTAMSKTLGYGATIAAADKLRVAPNELDVLQEILRIYAETRALHANVTLQSLTYGGFDPEALNGKYDAAKNNPYSYVHPIVAALFVPKINYFDEHMLVASLAHIVKCKHEGKPINNKPDYEVYWDMITDPNDTVCDMSSPLKDLKNRIVLQTRLWDSVFNLRQGKYYNDRLVEFLLAVDNCRNNIYDVPDLTYVKDEGAITRRLLSAFSLRPTVVSTTPLYGVIGNNPYINPTTLSNVTTIPMVNVRLPLSLFGTVPSVDLISGISQPQWFVENKMLVPKQQAIIHSRDVMLFYVNRRYQTVNFARLVTPYNFQNLPMTVSGLEKLNSTSVNFDENITMGDDRYVLKSVVLVETGDVNTSDPNFKSMIVGTSAILFNKDATGTTTRLHYTPQQPNGSEVMKNMGAGNETEINAKIRENGTIFVYQKTVSAASPFFA